LKPTGDAQTKSPMRANEKGGQEIPAAVLPEEQG